MYEKYYIFINKIDIHLNFTAPIFIGFRQHIIH